MARTSLLSVVLLVIAVVLVVVSLVRDGNNSVIALAGVGCAVAATLVATSTRGRSS